MTLVNAVYSTVAFANTVAFVIAPETELPAGFRAEWNLVLASK